MRRRIITGLVTGIAIALALAAFAVYQMRQAQKQTDIARAGELPALAISNPDKHFDLSLLFGLEGWQTFKNSRTAGVLLTLTNFYPEIGMYLFGHHNTISSVAFSPDGKRLAAGSVDSTISPIASGFDTSTRRAKDEPSMQCLRQESIE